MTKHSAVSRKLLLPLVAVATTVTACDDPTTGPGTNEIEVPQAYIFDSRFEQGVSSVQYPGQVVRNLLVQDLKILIGGLAKEGAQPITEAELLALYEHSDAANLQTLTTVEGKELQEKSYSAIATGKKLSGTASDAVVIGFNKTADELVRGWFSEIAQNSQTSRLGTPAVYTSAEGVDLSQMVEKVLGGAVVYSQGTGKYLTDAVLFAADNSAAVEGKPYTKMEHMWDEAFGYFGAARDYTRYTDVQLSGKSSDFTFDSSGDGVIDLESEYNYSFARYAGKRDKGGVGVNFTGDVFQAFLEGRTAIVNGRSKQEIAPVRDAIVESWEKLIAANVVHYINATLDDMETVTVEQVLARNNRALNAHWSEMRAFTVALQYNPSALISNAQLTQLAALMGTAPTYALPGTAEAAAAKAKLSDAKTILQSVYGFSDANMAGW